MIKMLTLDFDRSEPLFYFDYLSLVMNMEDWDKDTFGQNFVNECFFCPILYDNDKCLSFQVTLTVRLTMMSRLQSVVSWGWNRAEEFYHGVGVDQDHHGQKKALLINDNKIMV